jgi:selenocysteine lyase/cysteine desulfurase
MALEVARPRADAPGCEDVAHVNNAGATLPPATVTETMIAHLRLEARIGDYEVAARESARFAAAYATVARLVGAAPDGIAMVENAGERVQVWVSGAGNTPLAARPAGIGGTVRASPQVYSTETAIERLVAATGRMRCAA